MAAIVQALDAVLSVLLAPSCAACGELLERPTRGPVCAGCWRSIRLITPPMCDGCGDAIPSWRVSSLPTGLCPRCRRVRRYVDQARAVGAYDGALKAIVHALKYDGRRSLAKPLAQLMRQHGAELIAQAACAVPVPLHPRRRRERGFNQATDLSRHLGIPVVGALRRTRATAAQASLPAAQRHRNVRGAFAPTRRAGGLAGGTVLLVDDVSTTGATLEACAQILKAAGVDRVLALTVARVAASSLH